MYGCSLIYIAHFFVFYSSLLGGLSDGTLEGGEGCGWLGKMFKLTIFDDNNLSLCLYTKWIKLFKKKNLYSHKSKSFGGLFSAADEYTWIFIATGPRVGLTQNKLQCPCSF